MGTGDFFGYFGERRIRRAGILKSIFRYRDSVGASVPFAHQPAPGFRLRPRSRATRPSFRNIFERVFSLRRVDLPSPPCWIS